MTPEHTPVDEYTCPEPGCEFVLGAAGPVDGDEPDEFAEEVRAHQERHFAERVEALSAPAGPSPRLISTLAAALLAVGGMVVGYGLHEAIEPSARECVVAVNTADRLFIGMTNLLSAVRVRGDAVGREAYADADDEVVRLLDETDPLAEDYNASARDCTGGAR